jgi:hypothetical protein
MRVMAVEVQKSWHIVGGGISQEIGRHGVVAATQTTKPEI